MPRRGFIERRGISRETTDAKVGRGDMNVLCHSSRVAVVVAMLVALEATACGVQTQTHEQPEPASVFSPDVRRVVLEVDYATGAAPYTGASGGLDDLWQLAQNNLQALFAAAPREIVVPNVLGAMEQIDVPPGPYTGTDLVDIAKAHRTEWSSGDTVTFYAVWLNGYYSGVAGVDTSILGAALPEYGVIAIFKPVVLAESQIGDDVARFTEQSTLVHELGHTLGLVNTGLPETSPHEDPDHPGHCTDPNCVMYWTNEGGPNLFRFATERVQTGSTVLFDQSCLDDAKAAATRSGADD
jgi:predicted Zn-dependent protease